MRKCRKARNIKEVIVLYNRGLSCREIAEKTGVHTSTIWLDLKKRKLTRKLNEINWEEKNGMWKGDNFKSINQLHNWVRRRFIESNCCPSCGLITKLDLVNKGLYLRDLDQWKYLCRKCHMIEDGRLDKLHTKEIRQKALQTRKLNYGY